MEPTTENVPQPESKPQTQPDETVVISKAAWVEIDNLLANLPYRTTAPIVQLLSKTGGVKFQP